jgi:hypothetical protein
MTPQEAVRYEFGDFLNSGVYIIQMGKYFKIGVSTNITKRKKNLDATLMPEKPEIRYVKESSSPYVIENLLHKKYLLYNVRGEWFDLNPDVLKDIVDTYGFIKVSEPNFEFNNYKDIDSRIKKNFKRETKLLNIKKRECISAKKDFEKFIKPYETFIINAFINRIENSKYKKR